MPRLFLWLLIPSLGLAATSYLAGEEEPGCQEPHLAKQPYRAEYEARMKGWEGEIAHGTRPLREIVGSIRDFCVVYYPAYLDLTNFAEEASTQEEQIGRNMKRLFFPEAGYPESEGAPIRERMEKEMSSWN